MTMLDYAQVYETQYRPGRRLKCALAHVLWAGLLIVRPSLALSILAERRSTMGW